MKAYRFSGLTEQEEGMQRTFRIGVALGQGRWRTVTIVAEDAMKAVISGLGTLGFVSLELVTGITICEL